MNRVKVNIKEIIMKKSISCLLIITGLFYLSACQATPSTQKESSQASTAEQAKIKVKITILNEEKEVSQKELTVSQEDSLMKVMKENFSIKEENGMITEIEGIAQDEKENFYWTYTINQEMVNTGANDTKLNENDEVEFNYAKF